MSKHGGNNQVLWATGKHAVITGGSSGIGLETAKRLNGLCRKLSLVARNHNGKLEEARELLVGEQNEAKYRIRTEICTRTMDVRDFKEVQAWIRELYEVHREQVDIFVNCAGGSHIYGKLEQMDISDIEAIFDTNAKAPIVWMRVLLPYMKQNKIKPGEPKRGHVLMLSSRSGERTLPKLSVYTAAKGSVEKLVEAMQKEYAQQRIVFTLINPGSVNTAFTARWDQKTRDIHNDESITVSEAAEPIVQAINVGFAVNKISYESVNQWLSEPGVLLDECRGDITVE